MRSELSMRGARRRDCTGPNWRGVGRIEVGADLGPGIGPGGTLLVNFDCRRVVVGGHYVVSVGDTPELVRFRRFPRGLCAKIGGRWVPLGRRDLSTIVVIGKLLSFSQNHM